MALFLRSDANLRQAGGDKETIEREAQQIETDMKINRKKSEDLHHDLNAATKEIDN